MNTMELVEAQPYDLAPVTAEELAGWDQIVDRYQSRCLFHRTSWLDYLKLSRSLDIARWAIRDGSQTLGYLCGGLFEMGPFRILGSPLRSWGTNAMGPLINATVDQRRLLRGIDVLARREGLSMLEIENGILSDELLKEAGFEQVRDWTYLVALSSDTSQLWQSLESECRNRIRKSERAGVRVEIASDPAVVDEYYDLYDRLMQRKGRRAPFDRRTVHLLFARLQQSDNMLALRARDDAGRVIAAGLFPHDDEMIYFWSGASDETAHALCPNDLLHWTAMSLASRQGLRSYNMSGYGRFKRKFGGELVGISRWHKCYSRSARWARQGYRYWFEYKSTFDPRRLGSLRSAGHTNGTRQTAATKGNRELPLPMLRQRPSFRVSDIYRAPLHDFPIRDEILFQHLLLKPDMDLLEIGPGSGITAFRLARQVRSITLGDVAEGNVTQLRQALGHIPNLDFACVDVCKPGLPDALQRTFDAVYAIEVFELLPEPVMALANLAAVTRPGGTALIQFPNYPPEHSPGPTHFTTKQELARELEKAGFSRWSISAIRLRPHARYLYNYLHEKPIRAYRRRRSGHSADGALVYDESWTFRHGHRLQPFKYVLHTAWTVLSASIHAGGPAFENWDPGARILNHNLLVMAQR
jgi:SAM-dependent methyltransferase